jgi:hypothetical protein
MTYEVFFWELEHVSTLCTYVFFQFFLLEPVFEYRFFRERIKHSILIVNFIYYSVDFFRSFRTVIRRQDNVRIYYGDFFRSISSSFRFLGDT